MAKQQNWRVVRTSGGYGVLKSSGMKASKTTVVRPNTANVHVTRNSAKSSR